MLSSLWTHLVRQSDEEGTLPVKPFGLIGGQEPRHAPILSHWVPGFRPAFGPVFVVSATRDVPLIPLRLIPLRPDVSQSVHSTLFQRYGDS